MPKSPSVMGIINVTPDSFSDGGQYSAADIAIEHGLNLVSQGADWLDIGGESTRPGAMPVSAIDEIARTLPVITGLRANTDALISIDTMKPDVAIAAIQAGADMWNDVSAGRFAEDSLEIAAQLNCKLCLMHMQGEPRSMQVAPRYEDVVSEVAAFLVERKNKAIKAGVKASNIWVDPGIGFGKTLKHNTELMRNLDSLSEATGLPILFGASRKRFIAEIDPQAQNADQRLGGSIAVALNAAEHGADIIRVHDVQITKQALKVHAYLANSAMDDDL
ncbi:dihydropteroate synthase [Hirschia baltica]|uniref:Dihydropteroate synthase n=1 Tax=Hirschia baltica (strain ATCC 49814 / DSM 5838 / IFAM 1418) TaxID=582402 RepID=C6XND9_HIRBI|nr:dihydropteroate synthase [Hirschia baltica]ACT60083.1 dihydropteroate synthase [Hirschia baltica ATCC 49814]